MTGARALLACIGLAALFAIAPAYVQTKAGETTPVANPPPKPSVVNIEAVNRWDVTYEDDRLGVMRGTAYVDWNFEKNLSGAPASGRVIGPPDDVYRGVNGELTGKAHLVIHDPATGQDQDLWAYKITRAGPNKNNLTMVFEGTSPSAKPVDPPDTSKFPRLATDDGQKVKITVGAFEQEAAVRSKARPQSRRVTVELSQGPNFGVLDGMWHYYADPLTERDLDKKGRVGTYRLLNKGELAEVNNPPSDAPDQYSSDGAFLGRQTEWEQWWPLPTEIAAISVVEEQLSYRKLDLGGPTPLQVPVFQAPFQDGWQAPAYASAPPEARYRWNSEEDKHRTLLVIGRNLPIDMGKSIAFGSAGDDVASASIIATSQDKDVSDDKQALLKQGWAHILAELADKGRPTTQNEASRGMDWVLVRVTLKDRVLPGPETFSWGGAKHDWLLQFGNNTVGLRLVRPLSRGAGAGVGKVEASPVFYLLEQVAVEVQTRIDLPLDEIPVIVAAGGGTMTMSAHRIETSLYRTDFFQLGGALAAQPGSVLRAAIDQRKLLDDSRVQFVKASLTSATVAATPDATKAADGPWKDALLRAARADKIDTQNLTLAELANKPFDEVLGQAPAVPVSGMAQSTLTLTGDLRVRVSVGDHAAMLLLRDAFIDMMTRQLAWLRNLQSEEDLRKFREWLRPFVLSDPGTFDEAPESPFSSGSIKDAILYQIENTDLVLAALFKKAKEIPGIVMGTAGQDPRRDSSFARIAVTNIDGSPMTLYDAFDQESTIEKSATADDFRKWQIGVARDVASKYAQVVQQSLFHARGVQDSDVAGLLKLTGIGFGAVVGDLTPRLMRLSAAPQNWEQDPIARAAIANLHTTAEAVRAQADYSSIQDQYLILALTGIVAAPAIVSEGAFASVVSLAGNVTLWGAASVKEILETHQGQQDVQFEFGNALVLGPERLHQAEIQKSGWFQTLLSIGVQGALLGLQAKFETLPKIANDNAAYSAERLLAKLGEKPSKAFEELTAEEQNAFMQLVTRAQTRMDDVAPVSAAEVRARAQAEVIAQEAVGSTQLASTQANPTAGNPTLPDTVPGPPPKPLPAAQPANPSLPDTVPGPPPPPLQGRPGANPNLPDTVAGPPPQPATPARPNPALPDSVPEPPRPAADPTQADTIAGPPPAPLRPTPVAHQELGADLPRVNDPPNDVSWVKDPDPTTGEVQYKVRPLGKKGATSEIYDILDVRGRDRSLLNDPNVMKNVRDSDFGTAQETIERMRTANDNLLATRGGRNPIEFAEVVEFHKNGSPPYIIQRKVTGDNVKIFSVDEVKQMAAKTSLLGSKAKSYEEVSKIFVPGQQRALAKLYADMVANGLRGTDLSLLNLYFKQVGDGWIAGILDVDFIVREGQVDKTNFTWRWMEQIANDTTTATPSIRQGPLYGFTYGIYSFVWDGRAPTDAATFMEKQLENKLMGGNARIPFVVFNKTTQVQEASLIHPDIIKEFFPNFGKNPTTGTAPTVRIVKPPYRRPTPSRRRHAHRAIAPLRLAA